MTKGFHLARLEDGQDVPTTRGPSALMAPGDEYGALQQLADVIAIRQIILNFDAELTHLPTVLLSNTVKTV